MQTLIWFVLAYGFTNILVYGSIFNNLREGIHRVGENILHPLYGLGKFFSELIKCVMCTSTWVGFFLGIFIFSPTAHYFDLHDEVSWFFDGLLASGAVWAINAIVEWFEENRK